ncbi:MAG: UDP-2,3-diacylglucosamine diphosphatase [Verrucomicrobia bacterium]|nr:UDP-2,3-diacylglucosamine diphosphatase [Verrucomicrobiota bacterium]
MKYNAIWISDLHLGSRHSQAELLLSFLHNHECRHLYLVGDIIDGWELRRRWLWSSEANTVIQKILRMNRKQTQVTYVFGNHDEFMEQFLGLNLGGVRLVERAIHEGMDGRRYLVLHGHQLDGLVLFNRLLERVGARLYDWILEFNLHLNRLRRRMGFGYWSVAAYLKFQAKGAVRYVTQYEEAMVRLARQAGVEGVICGHIHRAEIRTVQGFEYLNCGDWVESCTALAEDFEGNIHLLRLDDSKNTPLNDPAVGGDSSADRTRMRRSERSDCRSVPMDPVGDIASLSGDLPLFRSNGPSSRDPRTQAAPLQHLRRQS